MPVKFPRPALNKSGTKVASILHQIHGSLTTRQDPMARDNWGLSGVLDSLTPRGHLPYPHSLREGRNHSPCHFDTSLVLPPLIRPLKTGHEQFIQQDPFPRLDHRLHQCVRAKTYSIWNQYCGLCTKLTYVT